jgi:hypothetical protein
MSTAGLFQYALLPSERANKSSCESWAVDGLFLAKGGWRGSRSPARVAGGCHWRLGITALTRWLVRLFCGNRECGLRPRTPPPAFRGVVGIPTRRPYTAPRLADWVSGRRLHSPLPHKLRANPGVDAVARATQMQTPASVSQRTDARSASHAHQQSSKSRRPHLLIAESVESTSLFLLSLLGACVVSALTSVGATW